MEGIKNAVILNKNILNKFKDLHMFIISIFIIIFNYVIVFFFWFSSSSEIIQYGDAVFPWRPETFFLEHLYIWNTVNGGFYSIRDFGWFFTSLVYFLLYKISNNSIVLMEKIMFLILLSSSGISMYYWLTQINKSNIIPNFIASIFYMYSLYQAVIWSGVHMTSIYAYSFFPLILAFYYNIIKSSSNDKNKRVVKNILLLSCFSILIVPSFSNVPFLLIIINILLLYNLFYIKNIYKRKILMFTVIIILILINSWFILPSLGYLSNLQQNEILSIKEVSYNWVKWKSEYAVLSNLIRVLGHVGFKGEFKGEKFCIYCSIYDSPLFIFIGFLLPIIALIVLLSRNKYMPEKIVLAILLLISLELSRGVNSPIFRFMFNHIPIFFIFRSPWEKFMWIYVFSISSLLALSMSIISSYLSNLFKNNKFNFLFYLIVLLLVMSYNSPTILGKMFPTKEERHILPPSHVDLPLPYYVYKTAEFLNKDDTVFRVLLLPNLDRAIFTWGLSSNSHLLPYLVSRDFAANYPGPPINNFDQLREIMISKLYKGENITQLLKILNIKYVVQRNDIVYNYFGGKDSPEFIKTKLNIQSKIKFIKSLGKWDIYVLISNSSRVYLATNPILINGKMNEMIQLIMSNDFEVDNNVIFLSNQINKEQWQLLKNLNNSILINKKIINVTVYDGHKRPFNWYSLPNDSIEARYYYGWKPVIMVGSGYVYDVLSFPSLKECPYKFPSYSPKGWSAHNSTLIFIKTGSEPLIINRILENGRPIKKGIIGIWWETGWMGMGTKPVRFPVTIPPHQKAIIQIDHIIKGNITICSLDLTNLTKLNEIKTSIPTITFKRVNPTKYIVSVENATKPFFLVFSESYHPQWKIYIEDKPTEFKEIVARYPKLHVREAKHDWFKFTPEDIVFLLKKPAVNETLHFKANGYANAWYIDPKKFDKDGDGKFTIIIYFLPQSLFYLGLFISGSTLFGCIGYLFYDWRREKGDEWAKRIEGLLKRLRIRKMSET